MTTPAKDRVTDVESRQPASLLIVPLPNITAPKEEAVPPKGAAIGM